MGGFLLRFLIINFTCLEERRKNRSRYFGGSNSLNKLLGKLKRTRYKFCSKYYLTYECACSLFAIAFEMFELDVTPLILVRVNLIRGQMFAKGRYFNYSQLERTRRMFKI